MRKPKSLPSLFKRRQAVAAAVPLSLVRTQKVRTRSTPLTRAYGKPYPLFARARTISGLRLPGEFGTESGCVAPTRSSLKRKCRSLLLPFFAFFM